MSELEGAGGLGTVSDDALLSPLSVGRILRCKAFKARKLMMTMAHEVVDGQPHVRRDVLQAWIDDRMVHPEDNVGPSVYFVASMDLQRVKIGKTRSRVGERIGRVADLQRQSPYPLLLVAVVDGYSAVERWFHVEFKEYRLHGEWFLAHPALDALILRIQAEGRGVPKHLCPGAHMFDTTHKLAVNLSAWHPNDGADRLPFVGAFPSPIPYGPRHETPIQRARHHYMKNPDTDGRSKQNRQKRRPE